MPKNFDAVANKNQQEYKNNNPLAPQWPFRWLVVGESGSGKTNLILEMILEQWIFCDKIFLYCQNLQQPKYQYLIKRMEQIAEKEGFDVDELIYARDSLDDVIPLRSAKKDKNETPLSKKMAAMAIKPKKSFPKMSKKKQNLVIFDDFVTEKDQSIIENYFIGGRHKGCSSIYLSQSFTGTPTKVRANCTHYSFYQCGKDIEQIVRQFKSLVSKEEFYDICRIATQHRYHFLFIDKDNENPRMKFRQNMGLVELGEREETTDYKPSKEAEIVLSDDESSDDD